MEVVYDTGSDWLTIEGDNCRVCKGNTFNHENSASFKFLETVQSTNLSYGSAELKGLRASDQVCLPKSNDLKGSEEGVCLEEFEFFLVSEQEGLTSRIDGVLGLSRSKLPANLEKEWRGIGPLYVKHLAKAGLIKENTFSFFLESYSDNKALTSFIDIGTPVEEHMRPGQPIVWFKLKPHMYWMVTNVSAVRFTTQNGSIDKNKEYKWLKKGKHGYDAIFDSGTSLTMVPQDLYEMVLSKLLREGGDIRWEKQDQMYLVNCKTGAKKLPSLELLIDNYWVEMRPQDYLV
mmetsp:Transcript_33820/g.44671  ORF Transcript_33820/g.44671 Transcript_33820/m.44671 type:complete len:289 (+) Transcript_33820:339-1205(+)|eukprot:CAMPEP_0185570414 /NCGR_PEP_ID=MMETSP0434-20130131/2738_1 /TAXON_ID=626734 ORGANISM="Favella taraikaensis, Strain Fe Narragansett Bay" /NCGR_SAMPLE_ID=MMETSP0434 /ASSEMBLY_ACC=CAM_ASM_000379 /LENGTH=288 /DNA_ID=CAMNT_0028185531 /DNA_START=328 /DNA_END=1194 /DNA_ORIENTATION=+